MLVRVGYCFSGGLVVEVGCWYGGGREAKDGSRLWAGYQSFPNKYRIIELKFITMHQGMTIMWVNEY